MVTTGAVNFETLIPNWKLRNQTEKAIWNKDFTFPYRTPIETYKNLYNEYNPYNFLLFNIFSYFSIFVELIYIYIYTCIYVCTCVYVCTDMPTYAHRYRDRKRERESPV